MAENESTRPAHGPAETETPKSDWTALVNHVQERPGVYIGAVAFVLLVLAATGVYRAVQASTMRSASTEYAKALEIEDAADRTAALAAVAESGSPFAAQALYLEGESALDHGDHAAARTAFQELRDRFPGFEFVPDAVEGLGFIEEDSGNFADARRMYEEVSSKWPESAAAVRQPYNLARCYEGESNLASAVEAYRKQLEAFPGSTVAMRAQQRLNELRDTNPELFADETPIASGEPLLQELTTEPLPVQLELQGDAPVESTEAPQPAPSAAPEESEAPTQPQ